jgi:cytochrome c-type biogenesis protein CcmH
MSSEDLAAAPAAAEPPGPPPRRARSNLVYAGAAAALVAGAATLGWWSTTRGPAGHVPAAEVAAPAMPAAAPHALGSEQIDAMVERLVARLQQQPDDAEGWAMLGRTRMALRRPAEAVEAYRRSVELRPGDAGTLADYADALASANGGRLAGEPARLVARALEVEPDNLKALVLAGTLAFEQGDNVAAVRHWEHAQRAGPPEHPLVQMARAGIEDARARSAPASAPRPDFEMLPRARTPSPGS